MYKNFPLALILLFLIVGFPRVYGTEIPFSLFFLPFFIKTIISQYRVNFTFFIFILIAFFILICIGVMAWLIGLGDISDLLFMLIQVGKLILSFSFAPVIYLIIKNNCGALVSWALIQFVIIVISAFDPGSYIFLLGFISPRSADVFLDVIGLRAVGFGLYHVDGAILLISAVFLASTIKSNGFLRIISVLGAALMARSAFVAYLLIVFLSRNVVYIKELILLTVVALILVAFNLSGPLYEALEIFRSAASGGEIGIASVDHLSNMYIFPQLLETYIWGSGQFFDKTSSGLAFYMNTDVGYLRLLHFGGVFFTLVFLVINLIPLMLVLFGSHYAKQFKVLAVCFAVVFLIINLKGLQVISIFALVIPFFRIHKECEFKR